MIAITKLLRILILLLVSNSIYGDCGSGISIYPENGKIYKNSNFLIEFYMLFDTSIIKELGTKYPVRLESKFEKIELEVKEILYGEKYLIQAILKPQRDLKGNESYELKIYNLPDNYDRMYKERIKDTYDFKFPNYLVIDENDINPPTLISNLKLVNTSYYRLGCGPSSFAEFEYNIEDDSDILLFVELIEKETNKKRSCYIKPRNGKLYVGADMCSGQFKHIPGNSYEVRFKILDINGNAIEKWTEWNDYKIEITDLNRK